MLTYEEAYASVMGSVLPLTETCRRPLHDCLGYVLADSLLAELPNPAFDNSAVDGYLLGRVPAERGEHFEIRGEIRAGAKPPIPRPEGNQAVRIFTGAPVPSGPYGIVMQEDVRLKGGALELDEAVGAGQGIRRKGTDFEKGTELIPPQTRIGPAEIGLATWNGISELQVFRPVRVAIFGTGDELVQAGLPLEEGQIYDSNGPMLRAHVGQATPARIDLEHLPDDLEATQCALANAAETSDLIVISGGASVGDYDYVPAAVASAGEVIFHKVALKPGKPVLFGKIGAAFVFGLPGNPASAIVGFELFVRDGLRQLGGELVRPPLWHRVQYHGGTSVGNRDEFVRVRAEVREGEIWVRPTFEQGSFGLRSLSSATGLAHLKAGTDYRGGEAVRYLPTNR